MPDTCCHFSWSFTNCKIIRKNILKKPKAHTKDLLSLLNLKTFQEKSYI